MALLTPLPTLLAFGSLLAAGVLAWACWLAHREIQRRRRLQEVQSDLTVQHDQTLLLIHALPGSAHHAIISTTPDGVVTTFNGTAERSSVTPPPRLSTGPSPRSATIAVA